jgi:nucleotide-binding universal stress UspA family protein
VTLPDLQVRHVLVPLDGSEFALQALPTARALAERFGAALHAISVAAADDDAKRLGALAAAALGVEAGDDRALVVLGGEPAEEIARQADELDRCVVCMSTHGRGRLHGALVGSVARSVLQRSSGAIVALGPSADNPGWTPRLAGGPSHSRCPGSWRASTGPIPPSRSSPWPAPGRGSSGWQ